MQPLGLSYLVIGDERNAARALVSALSAPFYIYLHGKYINMDLSLRDRRRLLYDSIESERRQILRSPCRHHSAGCLGVPDLDNL